MTPADRELLELAAKAVNEGSWHPLTHDTPSGRWNPLTDDGDALRLAVKLHVSLSIFGRHTLASTPYTPFDEAVEEEHGPDPLAATRRAITRAAAAIGKDMK